MTTGRRAAHLVAAFAIAATGIVATAPASSATTTKFTSCEKMHKVYKYGISKSNKAQARAVREGMYRPVVKPKVYADSYKTLDRDKDGTMCEVPR